MWVKGQRVQRAERPARERRGSPFPEGIGQGELVMGDGGKWPPQGRQAGVTGVTGCARRARWEEGKSQRWLGGCWVRGSDGGKQGRLKQHYPEQILLHLTSGVKCQAKSSC